MTKATPGALREPPPQHTCCPRDRAMRCTAVPEQGVIIPTPRPGRSATKPASQQPRSPHPIRRTASTGLDSCSVDKAGPWKRLGVPVPLADAIAAQLWREDTHKGGGGPLSSVAIAFGDSKNTLAGAPVSKSTGLERQTVLPLQ